MDEKKMMEILQSIAQSQSQILQRLDSVESGQRDLFAEVQEIKQGVYRIEESQPKDVTAMLSRIYSKLEDKDFEVSVLNKRVFKLEAEVERINEQ